jgi:diketogulonate reductase-like aldo/keto reductase
MMAYRFFIACHPLTARRDRAMKRAQQRLQGDARRLGGPAPACCVIRSLLVLAQRVVARQQPLHWPGTIRNANVIAIPESGSVAHVRENVVALSLTLTLQELRILDAAHPPRGH